VTRTIRDAVAELVGTGRRPLLLGGCCALLMGAVAGARDALARDAGTRPGGGRLGLAYVDGHVDVYDHRTSPTGEAADMPVAALLGLGWAGLLGPLRPSPVLAGGDVVVLGARDPVEAADIGDLPRRLSLTLVGPTGIAADPEGTGSVTVERFAADALPYWLHVDLDVLDEAVFPATDYLMPGGLDLRQLAALLRPIGRDPALVGASVACYNPDKDPDGSCGAALGDLLVDVLGGARREAES
jgi:arginase